MHLLTQRKEAFLRSLFCFNSIFTVKFPHIVSSLQFVEREQTLAEMHQNADKVSGKKVMKVRKLYLKREMIISGVGGDQTGEITVSGYQIYFNQVFSNQHNIRKS